MFETIVDGELKSEKIFKDIVDTTPSYTLSPPPTGLLSKLPILTQPAFDLTGKSCL